MSRVTQKGQVTIPSSVRKILDIRTGDELVFEVREGGAIMRKKSPSREAFQRYVGFLSYLSGREPDEIVDELRGNDHDLSH